MVSSVAQLGSEKTVKVQTPSATYDVQIGAGLLPSIADDVNRLIGGRVQARAAKVFLITSPEIAELWAESLLGGFRERPPVLLVPAGEQHKRLSTVERLAEELAGHGADRGSLLIALGGGVLGDLTGFLAAIYMRGVPYVQVPTTALAQIDSSVGGKTGANLAAGKNLVGAFHHPLAVYADVDTLSTLPAAELRAGLQEAVKAGILRDRSLFDYLATHRERILAGDAGALTHVICESVRIKAEIVAADERESGLRMLLNLGHTLGHAIEQVTGYTQLLHGEAVAWGMLTAVHIARSRKRLSSAEAELIHMTVAAFGALRSFTADPEMLVAATAKDKKHRGPVKSFVLPTSIGSAEVVHDVSPSELLEAAQHIVAQAGLAL